MSVIADHRTNHEIRGILAQRLRQRRIERNLLIDDLAVHAGVNRKTILALEGGEDIRLSSLIKILRSLDMLGLLEAAIPDSLPGNAALVRGGTPRTRARRAKSKAGRNV
jgi:DNA-binding XRE family transcriptional regulator